MIEESMKEKMMLSGTGISFFSTMLSWYVVNNSASILRCVVPLIWQPWPSVTVSWFFFILSTRLQISMGCNNHQL
jgi:uncharacterized membrane protein